MSWAIPPPVELAVSANGIGLMKLVKSRVTVTLRREVALSRGTLTASFDTL